MAARPLYAGTGECRCGRIDTRLYFIPVGRVLPDAVCAQCLERLALPVPVPRTERDLSILDGKLAWRTDSVRTERLSLGHDHFFEALTDRNDQLIGWLHTHPSARDGSIVCQSFCAVRPLDDAPVHQIVSAEPLTLTPSLKCGTCGTRGDVIDGVWVPG